MEVVSFNYMPLVRINAPDWYEREDFMKWLNHRGEFNWAHPATWHCSGQPPSDYSDVFITFDEGSGSDAPTTEDDLRPSIPEDIWKMIVAAVKAEKIDECLVWISNLK